VAKLGKNKMGRIGGNDVTIRRRQGYFMSPPAMVPPSLATFDPTNSNSPAATTLSNGNLTATSAVGGFGAAALTAYKAQIGKVYFELTMGSTPPNNFLVWLAANNNVYPNGSCWEIPSGQIQINGSNSGAFGPAAAAGATFGIAIDFPNHLIWITKDGSSWNNGSGDPNTPSGGVNFSAADVSAASWSVGVAFNNSGESVTGNWGQSAFSWIPSGYSHW
jgi:hypothetical protein